MEGGCSRHESHYTPEKIAVNPSPGLDHVVLDPSLELEPEARGTIEMRILGRDVAHVISLEDGLLVIGI